MVRPRIVAQDYHAPEASPPLAHAFLMHLQRPALRLGEVVVVEARMILVALLLIAVAITVRVEVAKGAVYDTKKVKLKSLKDGKWFGISEVYAIYTRDK